MSYIAYCHWEIMILLTRKSYIQKNCRQQSLQLVLWNITTILCVYYIMPLIGFNTLFQPRDLKQIWNKWTVPYVSMATERKILLRLQQRNILPFFLNPPCHPWSKNLRSFLYAMILVMREYLPPQAYIKLTHCGLVMMTSWPRSEWTLVQAMGCYLMAPNH